MNTFILFSMSLLFGSNPLEGTQGGLTADQKEVKLGEITDPRRLNHTFKLKNTSQGQTIHILNVSTPCGCAITKLTQRELKPNETADLMISINLLTQPEGEQSWKLIVKYKSGEDQFELPLLIHAKIIKEIIVEPASLVMVGSQNLSGKIKIFDRRKSPLKITQAHSEIPEANCQIHQSMNLIEINIGEKCPLGSYSDELVIKTNDPIYSEIRVPIRVLKRKEMTTEAFPDQPELVFREGESEATILVRIRGKNPIQVTEVIPNQSMLKCRFANGPSGQATLRITLNRKDVQNHGSGEILVKFADEKESPLVIPVTWVKP